MGLRCPRQREHEWFVWNPANRLSRSGSNVRVEGALTSAARRDPTASLLLGLPSNAGSGLLYLHSDNMHSLLAGGRVFDVEYATSSLVNIFLTRSFA